MNCLFCDNSEIEVVDSYKSLWGYCNSCGNVFRKVKQQYLMNRLLPRSISSVFLPKTALHYLYPVESIIQNQSTAYRSYAELAGQNVKTTKWRNQIEKFESLCDIHGIEIDKKKLLMVSGGPGFLIKHWSGRAKLAVVTEFDEDAVKGMRNSLGIEAKKYDFNTDDLRLTVREKFDFILIEYAINFCVDLKKFVQELSGVLEDTGKVYISFVEPTLGAILEWQFEEYTYQALYNPNSVLKTFAEAGLFPSVHYLDGQYPYLKYVKGKVGYIQRPFIQYYRFKARETNIPNDLVWRSHAMIFERSKPITISTKKPRFAGPTERFS